MAPPHGPSWPGPSAWARAARRPGHAGRAGGRGVFRVATGHARDRRGAAAAAPHLDARRRAADANGLRLLALVALCVLALQASFALRIGAMAFVDPQSTSFQRSEVWRLLVERQQIDVEPAVGALRADQSAPEACGHRQRGRRLRRAQRRRMGRHRAGLGEEPTRRGPGREGPGPRQARAQGRPRVSRRAQRPAPRWSAAPPSPSSWRRTCSCRASARCCARPGVRADADAGRRCCPSSASWRSISTTWSGAKACSARRPPRGTTSARTPRAWGRTRPPGWR